MRSNTHGEKGEKGKIKTRKRQKCPLPLGPRLVKADVTVYIGNTLGVPGGLRFCRIILCGGLELR